MRISELAAKAACDVQTVRFYEREGLLDEPPREPSGYRNYADQHLARLHFIRHCRSLLIPLSEVRQYIAFSTEPEASCSAVDALLERHIDSIQQQMAALRELEVQLIALRAQCAGGSACGILDAFVHATTEHSCACHA
jgi:DNA-binding transcriptional MerR regulator